METPTTSFASYITNTPPSTTRHQLVQSHQSRSSLTSLYDLLADLDEHQLTYLIQEMNHTAPQNMAVSQAISAIETDNPSSSLSTARANMQQPAMSRTLSKSQRIRLSLQTLFRGPSVCQPHRRHQRTQDAQDDDMPEASTTPTTPSRKPTSPAYKRISRPTFNLPPGITVSDLLDLLEAEFLHNSTRIPSTYSFSASSSFSSSSTSASSPVSSSIPTPTSLRSASASGKGLIRRYPSTIDMALEAERFASQCSGSVEGIALGLLEPRPTTPALGTPTKSPGLCLERRRSGSPRTPVFEERQSVRWETPSPLSSAGVAAPVVLDGIFEVLETR